MSRILGAPALHFTAAGALLFLASVSSGAVTFGAGPRGELSREIVIDAVRIRGLQRDHTLANRHVPSETESRFLVESAVTDEILFREALARGFEQVDRSVGWRLVQKMRFLGEDHGEDVTTLYRRALKMGLHRSDPVVRQILVEKIRLVIGRGAPAATQQELEAWYAEHASEYAHADRVTLRHVFFDRGRRGADGARAAAQAAADRARGHGAEVAAEIGGDPFVMGPELRAGGRADLTKFFGPAFANEALSIPAGAWSGPIESTYGWHIVLVTDRIASRTPSLDEVRSRVEKSYENSQRERRVEEFLARVRPEYTIRIDEEAIKEGSSHG